MKNTTQSPQEILAQELRNMYDAENRLVSILPQVAKATESKALRARVLRHLKKTKLHMSHVSAAMNTIAAKPLATSCQAVYGLLAEGEATIRAQSVLLAKFWKGLELNRRAEIYRTNAGIACL